MPGRNLTIYSTITESYWYLDQEVIDKDTGKTGYIFAVKVLGIHDSVKVKFYKGKKQCFIGNQLLSLTSNS